MIKTTVKDQMIFLNKLQEQKFNNRPMRMSGSKQNLQVPAKWIEGMMMHHYIHSFIYTDQEKGMFEFECDYQNKYIANSYRKC